MKITFAHSMPRGERCLIFCPVCHCTDCPYHGRYIRKGFHREASGEVILVVILRYLCLNPACERRTFSILPPNVLPYCRFFWPSILSILQATTVGMNPSTLAERWHVSRRVIVHATAVLEQMGEWFDRVHQEVCDGIQRSGFESMVKMVVHKLGRIELIHRWYRYCYPRRFPDKNRSHTIRLCTVKQW